MKLNTIFKYSDYYTQALLCRESLERLFIDERQYSKFDSLVVKALAFVWVE